MIPSKKKQHYLLSDPFRAYLLQYKRETQLPVKYEDLLRFRHSFPLIDQEGNDTLWATVHYDQYEIEHLSAALTTIYSILKADGDRAVMEHLTVARIDYCTFGNSKPFRVRIINRLNDNYDHFYVKRADASRLYGLELEHILSPNKMLFLVDGNTLVEEHVAGIPGDEFIAKHLATTEFEQIRIAKEFVKFNERCFVRLLGDMRAYNYVVDITPDIEGSQYRLRAIDFDQQSYEGRKSFYLPQYFKENNPIIDIGIKYMNATTITQYQHEERSMIAARISSAGTRPAQLLDIMKKDVISQPEKVAQLKSELSRHHKHEIFQRCNSMGELV
ncbi:MAG: hypothetical protein AAF570_07695, partial [Bacteroidota bacterium]